MEKTLRKQVVNWLSVCYNRENKFHSGQEEAPAHP